MLSTVLLWDRNRLLPSHPSPWLLQIHGTNAPSNLLTNSPLSLSGHFLCSHHFKLALRERADSPYLWNSGSDMHPVCWKMEAPLSMSTPWLMTAQGCYFPSGLFSMSPTFFRLHSNRVITDSCEPHVSLGRKVLHIPSPNTKWDASDVQKSFPLMHSSRAVCYSDKSALH